MLRDKNKQEKPSVKQKIQQGVIYSINENEKTASIIDSILYSTSIVIPRSIVYESSEYPVISILEGSFNKSIIKALDFALDSETKTIENSAFDFSSIESITIPSSLTELKDNWCSYVYELKQIKVMPNNPRYKVYDDKFIIGKSSIEQDNYDILVFCVRNIENVTIPSFIEIIGPYSFSHCKNLQQIEIPNDSKLRIIGEYAFSFSSITSISIPSNVLDIGSSAFECCHQLHQVEFPVNSKIDSIKYEAFSETSITTISIPKNVRIISDKAFFRCKQLRQIEFHEDSILKFIGNDVFDETSIDSITIPSNVS